MALGTFIDWARKHVAFAALGSAAIGALGGSFTTYLTLYEKGVTRVEEMKVAEFQGLVSDTKKFEELLSAFTEEIGTKGTVSDDKRRELSATLVRLYSGLGAFSVNLPPEQEPPVRKLQTSINEVKKQVQLTQKKQDLERLGAALVVMFRDLKSARPVMERVVGKPVAPA